MSTIRVDNFAPSAGGTEYELVGVAGMFGRADMTTPTLTYSYNVASLTDEGTGQARFNLTNSFAASDAVTTAGGDDTRSLVALAPPTTSVVTAVTFNLSNSLTDYDRTYAVAWGDYA